MEYNYWYVNKIINLINYYTSITHITYLYQTLPFYYDIGRLPVFKLVKFYSTERIFV